MQKRDAAPHHHNGRVDDDAARVEEARSTKEGRSII